MPRRRCGSSGCSSPGSSPRYWALQVRRYEVEREGKLAPLAAKAAQLQRARATALAAVTRGVADAGAQAEQLHLQLVDVSQRRSSLMAPFMSRDSPLQQAKAQLALAQASQAAQLQQLQQLQREPLTQSL